jgi:hypothetical protein
MMPTNIPDVAPRFLPSLRQLAMWHPESGLVASPYTRLLPSRVTWDRDDKRIETLSYPRLLEDKYVYLAFYPRKEWHTGALFSPLAHPNFSALIVETSSNPPVFMLSDDVCQAWEELENFLLDVSMYLFSEHPDRRYLPDIEYPRWPSQCDYTRPHRSMRDAFESVKNSLHAFRLLSAFVSFTLSLWIGQLEDTCLDRPFEKLLARTENPFLPIQLDYLRDSIVCSISAGLRPGGFLNPYETKWGRTMYRISRFHVPLWMIWGHEQQYKGIIPADPDLKRVFLPPEHLIEQLKGRHATFSLLIVPNPEGSPDAPIRTDPALTRPLHPSTSTNDDPNSSAAGLPDTADNGNIVDVTLLVDTYRSVQRPGERWELFRARMEEGLQKRKNAESEKERQSREALEANARKNGYSKKTTVFVWEEDEAEPGFYRRTKVDRVHADMEWSSCTEHQRFFWSHRREWDLVPHLPRCPPGAPPEKPVEEMDIDDPDFNFLLSKPPNPKPIDSQNEGEILSTGEYIFSFSSLTEYLKHRHGYSTSLIDNWYPELHNPSLTKKLHLTPDRFKMALYRLGYPEKAKQQVPTLDEELMSIVNFQNICVAASSKKTRFDRLPGSWDLGSSLWIVDGLLHLRVQIVKYDLEDSDLFVIRPKSQIYDSSSWYIATTSPTAVLLVFRRRWFTMRSIAQGFLDLGIPFHTVEE